jgi:hypothetical protein
LLYWVLKILAGALHKRTGGSSFAVLRRLGWGERDDVLWENLTRKSNTRRVLAQGWLFRNENLLLEHADAIRDFFEPVPVLKEAASSLSVTAREGVDVVVGVHIRQADYRQHRYGRYYFETARYVEAMRQLQRLLAPRSVGFLVCSDEQQDPSEFSDLRITFGLGGSVAEMYALAQMDYLLGPPSSFSLWASFYGSVPLFMITDTSTSVDLSKFRYAPDIYDEDARRLH